MKTKEQIIEVLKKRKQDFKFQIFESKEIDRAIEIIQRLVPPDYLASELSEPEKESKLNKGAKEYFMRKCNITELDDLYTLHYSELFQWMQDYASQFQEQPINQTVAYNVGLQDYGQEQSAKDYLNECIERATPNLSKIKDVDKELTEIRGEQPITDGEIEKEMDRRGIIAPWDRMNGRTMAKWALSLKQKAQPGDEKEELKWTKLQG
jgi:hypothetical protein